MASFDGLTLLSVPGAFKHKASSVLNRSSEFKSEHMFNDDDITCWNSDQGTPQFVLFDFLEAVLVSEIRVMFQGGFVGREGKVEVGNSMDALVEVASMDEVEDSNSLQCFAISSSSSSKDAWCRYLRIFFPCSTDFYGRVTIYKLQVMGHKQGGGASFVAAQEAEVASAAAAAAAPAIVDRQDEEEEEEESDEVVQKQMARNQVAHPLCVPVAIKEEDLAPRRVGLLIPREQDEASMAMTKHKPLKKSQWNSLEAIAALAEFQPCTAAGAITNVNAATSANERPCRVVEAASFLCSSGLIDKCIPLLGRQATDEELGRAHTSELVAQIGQLSNDAPSALLTKMRCCTYVFLNESSGDAARYAAGSAIAAVEAVCGSGDGGGGGSEDAAAASSSSSTSSSPLPSPLCDAAVCVIRPPGHHAEEDRFMGFCIANNVAVAAQAALASGAARRVLIVDWDIHHGNGTQKIFAENDQVLFFSAHALYDFPFFSGDEYQTTALPSYTGTGKGQGYSVNVAWSQEGAGDAEYIYAFEKLLMPIARSFAPDLVLISAGFDSAAGDECRYLVTPAGYNLMTFTY